MRPYPYYNCSNLLVMWNFVDAVKFQMAKRLSGKQVLDLLFALPSSDSDSDVEPDDGASEELLHLDTADNSGRASPEPGPSQTTSGEQLRGNRRGSVRAQLRTSGVHTAGASPEPDPSQTTSGEQLRGNRRGGVRAQPRTSDVQTAGATPDPDQPQITPGDQLSDVDSDETVAVSLLTTDESDQDDSGWGNAVSQFDVQFDDSHKAPHVRSPLDNRAKEHDYFRLLFCNDIVENLVEQTNLYATQPKTKTVLCRGTRVHKTLPTQNWTPVTKAEIEAFIGIFILMAIHQLPEIQHYWSSDPLLSVPAISQVMTSKRFKKLVETIHVNDNQKNLPRSDPQHDKLHKVRPLVDHLNKTISEALNPSNSVSVDESMIPFKGRSALKQYMPLKPIKRGYKVWCLADAKTGYVLKFEIYTGKQADADATPDAYGLGERVVLNLVDNLDQSVQVVAFDNFFTTVRLMEELLKRGFHAIGTVRPCRRGLPPMLKEKSKLDRGQHLYKTKKQIAAIKWQDKRPVTMLSTGYSPSETVQTQRTNKDGTKSSFSCPTAVAKYNEIMGGVDQFDQLRGCYAIGRRSVKWWHRIFFYLIDLAVVNSFILWRLSKNSDQTYDQLSFRLRLARQLIGDFSSRKRRGPPAVAFLAHKQKVPDDVRTVGVGVHMPTTGPTFRRCRLCSTAAHEKRTRYVCLACNVPICAAPCFRKFHDK